MAPDTKLKECSYFLVRYVPDLVRDEGLNIGLLLHSPEEEYLDCLFTDDVHRIRRFHQGADLDFLRELQPYFEQEIKEHESDLTGYLREIEESFSNLVQISPPRPCRLSDPQAEIQDLFTRYVGGRVSELPKQDTRMRIKQRLTDALKRHGVLDHRLFEKRIPARQWTGEGDPFTFDYGYRSPIAARKPNGHIKLVHALSLKRDPDVADLLGIKIRRVREKEPAELTAVVEALPSAADEVAFYSHRVLLEHEIAIQPLAAVDEFALSIRRELSA